jgi:hypothetical protein
MGASNRTDVANRFVLVLVVVLVLDLVGLGTGAVLKVNYR